MNTASSDCKKFLLSISIVALTVLFYLFVVISKTPDIAASFLLTIIPVVIGTVLMLTKASKSNDSASIAICLLFNYILINANAYQIIFNSSGYLKSTLINSAGVFVAAGSLLFYTKFLKPKVLVSKEGYKRVLIIAGCASMLMCLVLLIFGTEINGAKLWISIGKFTIQLSEVIKFLVFVQFALIYNSNMSVKAKMICATACLICHSAVMPFLFELGTVVIFVLVYLITFFVHIRSRYSLILMASAALLLAFALLMVYGLHDTTQGSTDLFSSLINKVYDRLTVSDSNQANRAIKGIINGGLFGADLSYIIDYFSMGEDFALANLAQYLGVINMLIFIVANAAIVYLVYLRSTNEEIHNRSRYKLSFIFSSAIAVQTLISICSICGFVCGVGTPGLSPGGTQLLNYYIMSAFIVYGFLEDNALKPARKATCIDNERTRFYNEY